MAFNCFGLFGLEMVLLVIESNTNGPGSDWTVAQHVSHHLTITAVWLVVGLALLLLTARVTGWRPFARRADPGRTGWLVALVAVAVYIAIQTVLWQGFKPAIEFGRLGMPVFASQYLYYLGETWVIWCTLTFAQESANRMWPRLGHIPWGGIFLALTWGVMHIVTIGHLMTAVMAAVGAVIMGIIHNALNHDIRRSYPLLALAFLL